MKPVTGNSLIRASMKVIKAMEKTKSDSVSEIAGFVLDETRKKGKRSGLKIFVTAMRFEENPQ